MLRVGNGTAASPSSGSALPRSAGTGLRVSSPGLLSSFGGLSNPHAISFCTSGKKTHNNPPLFSVSSLIPPRTSPRGQRFPLPVFQRVPPAEPTSPNAQKQGLSQTIPSAVSSTRREQDIHHLALLYPWPYSTRTLGLDSAVQFSLHPRRADSAFIVFPSRCLRLLDLLPPHNRGPHLRRWLAGRSGRCAVG